MFNQDMYIAVACYGLHAVELVAEILPEVILDEGAEFQLHRILVTDS